MLEAVSQISEINEAILHLRCSLCQQVDCLFGYIHEKGSSYPESEGDCLVLWLRLDGRLVAVGFRVAAVFCAGAFLGVVCVGSVSVAVIDSLSCASAASGSSDASVTSLVTTMASST